jgi:hypothetical protein
MTRNAMDTSRAKATPGRGEIQDLIAFLKTLTDGYRPDRSVAAKPGR